jgi:para-nitrobenzyl esterase
MLETVSRAGFNGYACIFDHVPANWKKEGSNSVHSLELTYVFGDWDNSSGWWPSIAMISRASGAKSVDPELTAVDRRVSEAMMAMWTQFAGTGDPSVPGLIQWPPYRRSEDQYFYITDPLEVKTGFSRIAQE